MPEVFGDVTGYALNIGDKVYSREANEEGVVERLSSPDGDVVGGVTVYYRPGVTVRYDNGVVEHVMGEEVQYDLYKFEDLEKR